MRSSRTGRASTRSSRRSWRLARPMPIPSTCRSRRHGATGWLSRPGARWWPSRRIWSSAAPPWARTGPAADRTSRPAVSWLIPATGDATDMEHCLVDEDELPRVGPLGERRSGRSSSRWPGARLPGSSARRRGRDFGAGRGGSGPARRCAARPATSWPSPRSWLHGRTATSLPHEGSAAGRGIRYGGAEVATSFNEALVSPMNADGGSCGARRCRHVPDGVCGRSLCGTRPIVGRGRA